MEIHQMIAKYLTNLICPAKTNKKKIFLASFKYYMTKAATKKTNKAWKLLRPSTYGMNAPNITTRYSCHSGQSNN